MLPTAFPTPSTPGRDKNPPADAQGRNTSPLRRQRCLPALFRGLTRRLDVEWEDSFRRPDHLRCFEVRLAVLMWNGKILSGGLTTMD